MRIKVIKPLNTRIGGPSRTFQKGITRVPGEEMEMVSIVKGEEIDTNDDWYMQDNVGGNYYWSGGVMASEPVSSLAEIKRRWQFDENKMSWAHDSVANGGLGIVDLWNLMDTKGKGIKVAIIDTGALSANNDLKNKIDLSLSIDCITFTSIDDTDMPDFHGTKSAGVVAANGSTTVYGVAPDTELIIYRLFGNSNLQGYTDENFCFALQEARKAKVDIISMSFEMPDKPKEIDAEIKACLDQNIILIAAAGDENQNLGIKNNFPSSLSGCISVGAYKLLNRFPVAYSEHSCKSDFLFCLGPGDNILTTGSTSLPVLHQFTSAAAPFVAGVIALMLSYRKKNGLTISVNIIKDGLQKACDRIDRNKSKDEIEGFGVINPLKLFNLLKT